MDKRDIDNTINRYNERLEKFGSSEESLGWTRNNNSLRFEYLIKEWKDELSGSKICDFGCGFGDLYGFLSSNGVSSINYTGIDINNELVTIGKKRYPNAHFWIGDILNEPFDQQFDFTFSSGVFNHKLEFSDEIEFTEKCIEKIASFSTKGFAINFLSDKVEYKTLNNHNSSPQKILELCYKYSNNVILRNDYMPFEFTVYVRRDKTIDRTKLIYQ
ncbi:MAG: class I SAM-dependent methyltransferase [Bacteroidia bacterium]|nr:class I SAM-dependent methyltransferase [Bacteroidia bacterium]MBP9688501.1 class I SAM-dependent methyltransferase [Bacteroidia bacterium]